MAAFCHLEPVRPAVVQLITITDGEPTNEPEHKVFQVIKRAKDFMSQTPYGPKAIAFEFAQACIHQCSARFPAVTGPLWADLIGLLF